MYQPFQRDKDEWRRRYRALTAHVPELIAIHAGLRAATQVTVSPAEWEREGPALRRFADRAGLHLQVHTKQGRPRLVYSRHRLPAVKDEAGEENPDNRLGYPPCCVQDFLAHSRGNDFRERAHRLYSKHQTLDFRLNLFLNTTPFHLFRHFPCRPDCAETLSLAGALLTVISQTQPMLASAIVRWCSEPVLFLDVAGVGISLVRHPADTSEVAHRVRYQAWFFDGHPMHRIGGARRHSSADVARFDETITAL